MSKVGFFCLGVSTRVDSWQSIIALFSESPGTILRVNIAKGAAFIFESAANLFRFKGHYRTFAGKAKES